MRTITRSYRIRSYPNGDRVKSGAKENVWIDPQGYQAAVAEREQAFEKELKRQAN